MSEEIKGILEKPNVYSFGDECYLYFGDYNKLKHYITNLQEQVEFFQRKSQRLEKRNKEIYDGFIATTQELCDTNKRIDKAIEYINKNILISFDKVGFKTDKVAGIVVDKLLEILQDGGEE